MDRAFYTTYDNWKRFFLKCSDEIKIKPHFYFIPQVLNQPPPKRPLGRDGLGNRLPCKGVGGSNHSAGTMFDQDLRKWIKLYVNSTSLAIENSFIC